MLPFELTKDTPYLALSGELWSVFYEYFNRNWPCYKGFLLYIAAQFITTLRMALWSKLQNLNHILISQETPHTLPSWASYGVCVLRISKKRLTAL